MRTKLVFICVDSSPLFMANTKIIWAYNFLAHLILSNLLVIVSLLLSCYFVVISIAYFLYHFPMFFNVLCVMVHMTTTTNTVFLLELVSETSFNFFSNYSLLPTYLLKFLGFHVFFFSKKCNSKVYLGITIN